MFAFSRGIGFGGLERWGFLFEIVCSFGDYILIALKLLKKEREKKK